MHLSPTVLAFPSLQGVPSAAFGFEHAPVPVLHVPAVWHWSLALHTTGLLPVHASAWQVSVCVHAFPSLQVVICLQLPAPSQFPVLPQEPVAGGQVADVRGGLSTPIDVHFPRLGVMQLWQPPPHDWSQQTPSEEHTPVEQSLFWTQTLPALSFVPHRPSTQVKPFVQSKSLVQPCRQSLAEELQT